MPTRIQLGNLIGFLLFFGFSGYLQYLAIRHLGRELAQTGRTRKIRGHLVGRVGIVFFLGVTQMIVLLALLGIAEFRGEGLIFLLAIGVTLTGFFVGSKEIARIRKKRSTTTNDSPHE
jgi:hypothetical protein